MMLATQHNHTQPFLQDKFVCSKRRTFSLFSPNSPHPIHFVENESISTIHEMSVVPLKRRKTMEDPLERRYSRTFNGRRNVLASTDTVIDTQGSEDDTISAQSRISSHGSRTSSPGSGERPQTTHVIKLSQIEHCMPRAYIRICLAYRVSDSTRLEGALNGLKEYFSKVIRAKPYLAGNVADVKTALPEHEHAEIRFTTKDYTDPPSVAVKELRNSHGTLLDFEELSREGLPPSRLIPQEVSSLLENPRPEDVSPVLRVQANIVKGGLIVAIYLHHCVSDGTGFDLLTSGKILNDGFVFRHDEAEADLDERLKDFASQRSETRQRLSTYPDHIGNTREIQGKARGQEMPRNKPGRGCVIMLSKEKIGKLKQEFNQDSECVQNGFHSANTVLMALIWKCMTKARRPSVEHNKELQQSKLLIPINVRGKTQPNLPEDYFGAAVDSGKAVATLDELTTADGKSLREISRMIRKAIKEVDDEYVREMIKFVGEAADKNIDVQDIQASNMDRVSGADMYITSWLKQGTYSHDVGMGLEGPDWVRKPWSRDPGSCIILPENPNRPEHYEVVIQMTEADMGRLLVNEEFTDYVMRVVD